MPEREEREWERKGVRWKTPILPIWSNKCQFSQENSKCITNNQLEALHYSKIIMDSNSTIIVHFDCFVYRLITVCKQQLHIMGSRHFGCLSPKFRRNSQTCCLSILTALSLGQMGRGCLSNKSMFDVILKYYGAGWMARGMRRTHLGLLEQFPTIVSLCVLSVVYLYHVSTINNNV